MSDNQPVLASERRYRNSNYFLEDQLRCSEAVSDFKSVRSLVEKAQGFSLRNAFQFQLQPVLATVEVREGRSSH